MTPRSLLILFTIIGLCQIVTGQELDRYLQVKVLSGEQIDVPVNTQIYPDMLRYPRHGSVAKFKYGYESVYRIRYEAGEKYQGRDTVIYRTERNIGGQKKPFFEGFVVQVVALLAQNDHYAIRLDQEDVLLNVLANDQSTSSSLSITQISYISSGQAKISSDRSSILFTPSEKGYVRVGYVACDSGTCSSAEILVRVDDFNAPPEADTVKYIIERDGEITLMVGPGFTPPSSAYFGGTLIQLSSQIFRYHPRLGFSGNEVLKFQRNYQGQQYQHIVALEITDPFISNGWNKQDYFFTEIDNPLDLEVASNDLGGEITSINTEGLEGRLTLLGGGTYHFEPDPGFTGQTGFSYQSCADGRCDWAEVNLIVHNYEPLYDRVNWYTTKNGHLTVDYQVPIDEYYFEAISLPSSGTLKIGADRKSLQYLPDSDFSGSDFLVLKYCCPASDYCKTVYIDITVQDLEANCLDCIWPGDYNDDGTVDVQDAVVLATNLGYSGPSRNPFNANYWYGQSGLDWSDWSSYGTSNLKFVDGNGDGVVSDEDLALVSNYYDLSHDIAATPPIHRNDIPIALNLLTPELHVGDWAVVEVSLGDASTPVEDMLGLNFSFEVSGRFVDSSSIQFNLARNGIFNPTSSVIAFAKSPSDGRIDVGIGKTDRQPISGHGILGEIRFIVEEDLNGFRSLKDLLRIPVSLSKSTILTQGQEVTSLRAVDAQLSLAPQSDVHDPMGVYPNPTSDHVNLSKSVVSYRIFDQKGILTMHESLPPGIPTRVIDVRQLSTGLYLLYTSSSTGEINVTRFAIIR